MKATLLCNLPITNIARAVRMCTGTVDKSDSIYGNDELGPKDKKLISERILKQNQEYNPLDPAHESTLEHVVYTFELTFSRAVLQQVAKHRIASSSVESTRWALKRILKDAKKEDIKNFITLTGDVDIDNNNIEQVWKIAQWCKEKPNDVTKFALPECFKTKIMLTINARSLRNWFVLRTSSRALWEIRQVAFDMYYQLPESHKFLYKDRIHELEMKVIKNIKEIKEI
jgi:thymidylate synthase (FAD)